MVYMGADPDVGKLYLRRGYRVAETPLFEGGLGMAIFTMLSTFLLA